MRRIIFYLEGEDKEQTVISFSFASAPGAPPPAEINAKWVFGTKWDPL